MIPRFLRFITFPALLLAGLPVQAVDAVDAPQMTVTGPANHTFSISPGARFRDCEKCPEMVVLSPGNFQMGSPEGERGRSSDEGPMHEVVIKRPFAIGRYEITIAEWTVCVEARACPAIADDHRGGGTNRPVVNVSWHDAQQYTQWLSTLTGEQYRLPSESEWEYAARGGTDTPHFWADRRAACPFANVYDVSGQRVHQFDWLHFECIDATPTTAPVGEYLPNNFGLYDMLGNVWEWVEDCWNDSYANAPADGRPQLKGDCKRHIVRGGSWKNVSWATRSAFRGWQGENDRIDANGFRVARFSRQADE